MRTPLMTPGYMELLIEHHYVHHVLRRPYMEWPEAVNRSFAHINPAIYVPMQGPSELGIQGKLATWDRFADLHEIRVPTLVIGGHYDTMDPDHLRRMAAELPRGRCVICPEGSHLCMWDDEERYFGGLLEFTNDVEAGAI